MAESWKEMISGLMDEYGDGWDKVEGCAIRSGGNVVTCKDHSEWSRRFDSGYGLPEGAHFTVWTKRYVYFPVCYDGSEWCGGVPRNVCEVALSHEGGW